MGAPFYICAGMQLATVGFLLFFFVLLVWAFLGQRGMPRSRRLRMALSSGLMFIASGLSGVSLIYFVALPATISLRPEFAPPYQWSSRLLSIVAPVAIFAAMTLVIGAIYRDRGTRYRLVLISLGCFLLFLASAAANYAVIYRIQVPAFDRYAMIESQSWLTRVGEDAPDIEVIRLDGSPVRLSELRGKVVLLNFFATWCGPCGHELPHLQLLWNDLQGNEDFRLLVVDRKETQQTAADFQSKNGYTFPMAVDPDGAAFGKFANEGIPRTYLISRGENPFPIDRFCGNGILPARVEATSAVD